MDKAYSWPKLGNITLIPAGSPSEFADIAFQYLSGPHVAVSGGRTYANILALWSSLQIPEDVWFYPVDERIVSFDHADCNWRLTYELLLSPTGRGEQRSHWVTSKSSYQKLLTRNIGTECVFDQIYLGVGEDGHTASLFPKNAALSDHESAVLQTCSPAHAHDRITLGLAALWSCKSLIAVIMGENKLDISKRIFSGDEDLPISIALRGHPSPIVIIESRILDILTLEHCADQ